MKYLIALVAISIIISCASKKDKTKAEESKTTSETVTTDTLIQINRGGCFGSCPIDRTTILNNGDVIYYGKKFVDNKGDHTAKISMESIAQIKKGLVDCNFFELANQYPIDYKNRITDLPTVTMIAYKGVLSHSIYNTHDAPRELIDFQKLLVQIINDMEFDQ